MSARATVVYNETTYLYDVVRDGHVVQSFKFHPDAESVKDSINAQPRHGDEGPKCDCGGHLTWCAQCSVWTQTCHVDYGTCQCS
jgi:hypothetical protein